ncbi:RNA-directed DNA polymerase, eukaryota, reverse transcriptase zinc-binding domain protein, partial [Tanacetum coccineum]
VDDVVFVGKWDMSNLSAIINVLKWFFLASGPKINLHKNKLMGIGIPNDVMVFAARFIGCSTLSALFTYLGVKVGGFMSRLSSWDDVIAKLTSRLSKWNLKTLFIGGHLTFIKSDLSSLPLYHMSIFKVPMSILNKMEATRRNFFNGVENSDRRLSLISWKKILAFKKNGGTLANKGIDLRSLVKKKVGNGELTSFWDDIWLADSPLKDLYPKQYYLDLDKQLSVATKLRDSSLFLPLEDLLVVVSKKRNSSFSLNVNAIPIKINIFAWRVCIDKLPLRLNLSLRGIDIPSILCPLCSIVVESTLHLLFSCHLACQLMLKVAR